MEKKTYSEKLKDPRWQRKQLEIFQRDNFTCKRCESTTSTLNVHHKLYEANKEPWDYQDDFLITLCEDCHRIETELINEAIGILIQEIKLKFLSEDIFMLADGFHNLDISQHDAFNIADALRFHLETKSSIDRNIDELGDYQFGRFK